MAKRYAHFDFREDDAAECASCGWSGRVGECGVEPRSDATDYECPRCFSLVAIRRHPTTEETLARGTPDERERAAAHEERMRRWEEDRLREPGQLPDLEGELLEFEIAIEPPGRAPGGERWFVVRCAGREVWREVAWFASKRNEELARILQTRYGARFAGLRIADEETRVWLYD